MHIYFASLLKNVSGAMWTEKREKKNWLYRKWEGIVKWEQKDNRDTPNNAHPNDTEIRFNFNLSSAILINNRKIRAGVFKEALVCQFSVKIEAPHWNPLYEPSTHILIYFIVFKIRFVHDDYRYFCEPSRTVFFFIFVSSLPIDLLCSN